MEILKKSKMKVPANDDSRYKTIYAENSADNVKFSDTTLETVLNSLNGGKIPHADNVNFTEKAEKDSAGNKIVDYYLPINNAAMSGTPTAPTYAGTDTTVNQLCTCEYFNGLVRKVAGNIDSDMTLAKLIASINKDPNFATTIANQLDQKQNKNTATNLILTKANWKLDSAEISDYKYYYEVSVTGLTTNDIVEVFYARASMSVVLEAGICPSSNDSLSGKFRIYAAATPSANISATYVVWKG